MSNLGVMMAGGNGVADSDDEFFSTPPEAAEALLRVWTPRTRIWEPACGDGALSRVLEAAGHDVVSTNLTDRGYGRSGVDFRGMGRLLAPTIVTNPPFSLTADFIRHAFDLGAEELILLLKATYWHADNRTDLFERYRPAVELKLTWRLDFKRLGRPTMECCWYIWTQQCAPHMTSALLSRSSRPAAKSETPQLRLGV